MKKLLLSTLMLGTTAAHAETLVRHCPTVPTGDCANPVYVRPADARTVRVLRASEAPWVALSSVLDTERISVCVDDVTLVPGGPGPCTTRVPGRTDNWQVKGAVYAAPPPSSSVPGVPLTLTAAGGVTLRWGPPTTNEDGSPLTNLAGFMIYYHGEDLTITPEQSIRITDPSATSHTVSVPAGTWYFTLSAFNKDGGEGAEVPSGPYTVTEPEPGKVWRVASDSPVYEPVENMDGTAKVRGTVQGHIKAGASCTGQAFLLGTDSYRVVSEGDVILDSPTYRGRAHVALCTLQ